MFDYSEIMDKVLQIAYALYQVWKMADADHSTKKGGEPDA